MTIFISYGNINFVTLKMQSDRLCGSFSRAGFFSRLIYCCPLQPWPNILSLGVTTISMSLEYFVFITKSLFSRSRHQKVCLNGDSLIWLTKIHCNKEQRNERMLEEIIWLKYLALNKTLVGPRSFI